MSCNEWGTFTIDDLCEVTSSKRIYSREYVPTGVPFYRSKEIIQKHNGEKLNDILFISNERFQEIDKKFGSPLAGDMLLTSVGTLGIPYIVKENEQFYFKDGNLTWFRNFKDTVNSEFLYYWIRSPLGKNQIKKITIGSTQQALTISSLKTMQITLPDINEQHLILKLLESLDDKIELNNRINETLEEMAQAIFKHWFVDFEFPNKNGEPYKSSGGSFFEYELGMIPEGWKIGKLADLVTIKYGKDHKKLSEGVIPVYGSGGVMRYVDSALYSKESVLIPRKGTLSNVIYINEPFWSVDTMFYTEMKALNIAKFVYYFVKSKDLTSMNTGSAVPSMTTEILNKLDVVIPPQLILNEFESLLSPLFIKYSSNCEENKSLADIRDALLPKLMSAEIRIPDAEKEVEACLQKNS